MIDYMIKQHIKADIISLLSQSGVTINQSYEIINDVRMELKKQQDFCKVSPIAKITDDDSDLLPFDQ